MVQGKTVLTYIILILRYKKFVNCKSAVYCYDTFLTTYEAQYIADNLLISALNFWQYNAGKIKKTF